MNKEIEAYVDGWFAKQRGTVPQEDLVLHPHIQRWFDRRKKVARYSPEDNEWMPYIKRRITILNAKED